MRCDTIFRRLGRPVLAAVLLALLDMQAPAARGEVKLPAVFGSHMVLQRDQKDRVWGWADPGEEVTVKIGGQSHATKAGADGSWPDQVARRQSFEAAHPGVAIALTCEPWTWTASQ